jgi:V/A-type H+/Na+-transporting ATPase subunit F
MEIAVIGQEEFCLGFTLAGIKKINVTDGPRDAIKQAKEDSSIGVVIFDEKLLEKLDQYEKHGLEDSLKPVFITLSTTASEESLKKMIRKSIGVEL